MNGLPIWVQSSCTSLGYFLLHGSLRSMLYMNNSWSKWKRIYILIRIVCWLWKISTGGLFIAGVC